MKYYHIIKKFIYRIYKTNYLNVTTICQYYYIVIFKTAEYKRLI